MTESEMTDALERVLHADTTEPGISEVTTGLQLNELEITADDGDRFRIVVEAIEEG